MKRRELLKALSASAVPLLTGCGITRIDTWNVLLRSDVIHNFAEENAILDKARVEWSEDGNVRILYVRGSGYERGYQQGVLLRDEIQRNIGYLYRQALRKFPIPELFDEVYERMSPFIPHDYAEEMRGLAHGARIPLHMVHHIHILPDIGEWGGKKHLVKIVKQMMHGDALELWGTSCSNLCVTGDAAANGGFYTVRVLDWGLHKISHLHKYPLLTVAFPDDGVPNVNIGWVGFLGAVSGMNAKGITLGEMGYGDPPGEVLNGIPMCFMMREVLTHATSLNDSRRIIKDAVGTNSYVFLMSDGKTRDSEMYVKDRNRFLVFKAGEKVNDGKENINPIKDILYGGHYLDKMEEALTSYHGSITPEVLMKDIIPKIVMPSNFQNVVYDPVNLKFWVTNAVDQDTRAAEGVYTFFDFGAVLRNG